MATRIKDVVEKIVVATSSHNATLSGSNILVSGCVVRDAGHFQVGRYYILTDDNNSALSVKLLTLPGGGMQTASFSHVSLPLRQTDFPDLPGLDVLGSGYDVSGLYANGLSVMTPMLFDFGSFDTTITVPVNMPDGSTQNVTYAVPDFTIRVENLSAGTGEVLSGESFSSYWSSLSASVDISGQADLFSGSMSASFSQTTFTSDDFAYSQQQYYIGQWRLDLPPPEALKSVMTSYFKSDLATMDPSDLFDNYGAYYLASIVVGGRLNYSFTTDKSVYSSDYSLSTTVSYAWEGVSGGSLSAQQQQAVNSLNESSVARLNSVGGNPAYAQELLSGGGATALNNWFGSVAQSPVFCGFGSENPLQPIWALCDDADRAQVLQDAFPAWLAGRNQGFPADMPWLQLAITDNMVLIGNDAHSGADDDLETWLPAYGKSNWIGQSGQGNYGTNYTGTGGAVVTALSQFALRPPASWNMIWEDSTRSDYYGCWQPVAPVGYVALGHLMRLRCDSGGPPTASDSAGLMCVHKSLVRKANLGDVIWDDAGSGADRDVTLFQVVPVDSTKAYAADTLIGVPNYSTSPGAPPAGTNPYVLRRCSKVQLASS